MKIILRHLVFIFFVVGNFAVQFNNMDRIERYGINEEEYLDDNEMHMITPEKNQN
jgi:hypothetical protein